MNDDPSLPPDRNLALARLLDVLQQVFPQRGPLRLFLFQELAITLDKIVGEALPQGELLFDLLRHLDSIGHVDVFVKATMLRFAENQRLLGLLDALPRNWSFDAGSGRVDARHLPARYQFVGARRWHVEQRIGHGGRAMVYAASQSGDARPVAALKVLLHQSDRVASELDRELDALAQVAMVAPQAVPAVHDHGWDPLLRSSWFAMELLDGVNLREHIRENGRQPPSVVVLWVEQIARALGACHARDVVHCDLKPENVLITKGASPDPLLKLLDFGTAHVGGRHGASGMGTAAYAAPEQWDAEKVTAQTDIWTLGLLVYFVLTGHDYWRSIRGSHAELQVEFTHHIGSASGRAEGYGVRLPRTFDRWFERCVHVDAERRFPSIEEAGVELRGELARWASSDLPLPQFEEPHDDLVTTPLVVPPPTIVFGRPLTEVIRDDAPLAPHRVAEVLLEIAHQLDFARADASQCAPLDPSGVSVDDDGAVHLRSMRGGMVVDPYANYIMTSGQLRNTSIRYVSPRVLEHLGHAEPDDVWSLAMIAFEMLTGRAFLEGVRARDIVAVAARIPGVSERAAEFRCSHLLPPGFDGWFARCVTFNSARYKSAVIAAGGLLEILPPAPRASQVPPPRVPRVPMPPGMREDPASPHYLWSDPAGGDLRMGYVPPGNFRRGSDEDDEWPSYWCNVTRGMFVSLTPVTIAEFERFVRSTSHRTEAEKCGSATTWRAPGYPTAPSAPVTCVTWNDAKAWCRWAGLRLLTETEWEYAARGEGEGRLFPWGNEAPTDTFLHWSGAIIRDGACAVGSHPRGASPFQLLDMVGNVACWTEDAYGRYKPSRLPVRDPRNDEGTHRVVRGAGWQEHRRYNVRCSARRRLSPDDHDNDLGFRCLILAP